ncbi:unnamed protein product, partial [Vitis vinifera]
MRGLGLLPKHALVQSGPQASSNSGFSIPCPNSPTGASVIVFMASPERMRNQSFFSHDDDCDNTDDGYVYGYGCGYEQLHHPHNLSRLSMCNLNSMSLDEDEDDANGVGTSIMLIESSDGDADEELENEAQKSGFTSFSGESEGAGLVVITRPKGGRRSLCMDLEEVKACRDLGFELEHERMLEIPTRISISGSTLETSSGGNSPIASWRISSPGDDPRDVKARLKVWAQAVALASTSRHSS